MKCDAPRACILMKFRQPRKSQHSRLAAEVDELELVPSCYSGRLWSRVCELGLLYQ
jgi:hypothetical protein